MCCHGVDVSGTGGVAGPDQGGEVDLFEQRRRHPLGDEIEAAVMDGQDGIPDGGLLGRRGVAVVLTQRVLLENRFADETAGEQDDALTAGKRADPDQVRDGLEPVCFREKSREPGAAAGPARIGVGHMPGSEVVGVA